MATNKRPKKYDTPLMKCARVIGNAVASSDRMLTQSQLYAQPKVCIAIDKALPNRPQTVRQWEKDFNRAVTMAVGMKLVKRIRISYGGRNKWSETFVAPYNSSVEIEENA